MTSSPNTRSKWRVRKSKAADGSWAAIAPNSQPLHFANHHLALAYAIAQIDQNDRRVEQLVAVGRDLDCTFPPPSYVPTVVLRSVGE